MSSLRAPILGLLSALACIAPGTSGDAALVINEVLYDPMGSDGGGEWVELHNTGPSAAPLEGVTLEAGDGGGPGRWRLFWRGAAGEWIEAGGFWIVGGPYLGRPPDSEANCGLQNGPDGLRLGREGWELDRVGWGDLDWDEYFEGRPARTVGGGESLARRADGQDADENVSDFEAAVPTPGRRNHPQRDLSAEIRVVGRPIPWLPGEASREVSVTVRNRGTEASSDAEFELFLDGERLLPRLDGPSPSIAPGDSVVIAARVLAHAGDGLGRWPAWVERSADEVSGNDADTLRLWRWPPPFRLSELAPRPDSGRGEWIELRAGSASAESPVGWSLRDAAGTSLRITDSLAAAAGEWLLVAHDSLRLAHELPAARRVAWAGAWPSLNDRSDSGEAADTLWLLGPEGEIADWAVWGEARPGETWIRAGDAGEAQGLDAWMRIPASDATPGGPNPRAQIGGGGEDPRIAPESLALQSYPDGVWLRIGGSTNAREWSLRIVDLAGRELWRRLGRSEGTAEQWLRWDGKDRSGRPPSGMLLVELRRRDAAGLEAVERRSLWLAR